MSLEIPTYDDYDYAGYHGTTLSNAVTIKREGFKNNGYPVCFAPINNLEFAQRHGNRHAEEIGDTQYGVVLANFPSRRIEFGIEGDQINVPIEDIGRIVVRDVLVFETIPSGLIVPVSSIKEN